MCARAHYSCAEAIGDHGGDGVADHATAPDVSPAPLPSAREVRASKIVGAGTLSACEKGQQRFATWQILKDAAPRHYAQRDHL